MLSLAYFISVLPPEVKGVHYFPSRVNYLEIWKRDVKNKWLINSAKYHHYPLMVWSLFKKSENEYKNQVQIKDYRGSNVHIDLAYYSLTQWQFWLLTSNWLSVARAQDKKQIKLLLFSCFPIFIQWCDPRKIHHLTREFRVKLHSKTHIALIASRFVRYWFSRAI